MQFESDAGRGRRMRRDREATVTGPLNTLTIEQIRAGVDAGAFSAAEVVEACLARIAERDPQVQAWIAVDAEGARAAALEPRHGGPLQGVPFGVKDVSRTARCPTQMGAEAHAGATHRFDAAAVAVLRAAGGVMLGKTATAEYAGTAPADTRHPDAPAHTPGGSSSGSAAAVADCMVPFALGTQTGGSVIRPAAFCGVVGFKPTFGLYPVDGMKMAAQSFDTVGLFTRTAADAALLHSVLMNMAPAAAEGPVRFGVLSTHLDDTVDPAMAAALAVAGARLSEAGCPVETVAAPGWLRGLTEHRAVINAFERHRALAPEALAHGHGFRPETQATWEAGRALSGDAYLAARRAVDDARREAASLFDRVDVLLTAATPGEAPAGLHSTGDPRLQELWTTLHLPALCLPCGTGPTGLPLSVQLIGRAYADTHLLGAARVAEAALGGRIAETA